ncbi:ribonuclease T2 family protein [Legionella israelensis]|uniref:Ribonuclease, T2 family n=2 Tax=Legionella israelensis TaxID=454 RepID=A0A0W0WQJ2_9GAMM|nr:ribonuclease T [Legionella israelensis]KTD34584.1 ribonuclease, T2 family [Legionella israelensis]SCX99948.1 ribonuclease T2 [Legionella israelensis DSM 19235]STX60418.1 ribonuclease, T2 family [Legionella israelensis]
MNKLISFLFIIFSFNLNASILVSGYFEANQSCPAFLSKNKKTNPNDLHVEKQQRYTLREINRLSPDWLRIEIPVQSSSFRWVHAECGQFQYQIQENGDCEMKPGLADSYVLALSWQPAFCQTYGYEAGKPECLNLSETSYASHHMTLHGLWPNQKACGQSYSYCGVAPQKNHCSYAPVELGPVVATHLKELMPSYAFGSCLERHEWNKHGSCQVLSSDDYFSLAMRLAREADNSTMGEYLRENRGLSIKQQQLRQKIQEAFGQNADQKIYLGCKNGMLVDIFIQLPVLIPEQQPLSVLIADAPKTDRYSGCPDHIWISDFKNGDRS